MLRYRLEGSGSPLLLIHGWGVTYAVWQNLAPLLRPYFQLIMIELPGVTGSPEEVDPQKPYYQACAEAIEEVRQVLGIEQWSMLAYSSGTRAGEAYVQRYSQSITRAVFLCPTYIPEIWSFFVRLLGTPHPLTLTQWVFSDWRLYNLILALGFNWERHDYTYLWKHEIELQPLNTLVRSLYEMPGKGRAPFELPAVPTLFVWGKRDALTSRPRRPRPNDVMIAANHSAPMLAASSVAEVVIPFLTEGKLVASPGTRKPKKAWRYKRDPELDATRERARLLNLIRKTERKRAPQRRPKVLTYKKTPKGKGIL